jgi:hypothetical protein
VNAGLGDILGGALGLSAWLVCLFGPACAAAKAYGMGAGRLRRAIVLSLALVVVATLAIDLRDLVAWRQAQAAGAGLAAGFDTEGGGMLELLTWALHWATLSTVLGMLGVGAAWLVRRQKRRGAAQQAVGPVGPARG